jgi:hypothetical protein
MIQALPDEDIRPVFIVEERDRVRRHGADA